MATANTTSVNDIDYQSYPPSLRAAVALEMAQEIAEKNERLLALAISITNQLAPDESGDSDNFTAFRLAEVLENTAGDIRQQRRLIDCLKAMQQPEEVAA